MKTWLLRGFAVVVSFAVVLIGVVWSRAMRTEHPVGFEVLHAQDALGRTFPIAVWYPTEATPRPTTLLGLTLMSVARDGALRGERLPLVVISHGNGGGPGSHADLAMALADAGYVVAAPMHSGDNYEDSSGVGAPGFWAGRNRQVHATVEHMTMRWREHRRVDSARIGAFGFSAGGFTVLTAIGARPDLGRIAPHCARTREFVCAVLDAAGSPLMQGRVADADREFVVDPRIRAAVVAAPGLGFAFDDDGLANVRVPVQLWAGGRDTVAPDATNAAPIRSGLGARVEARNEAGAGHIAFLAPCALLRPPALCRDEDGFDRVAFHRAMNVEVVTFFDTALGR